MKARDLFIIILKIFGILFIKNAFLSIPPIIVEVVKLFDTSRDIAFFSLVITLLAFCLNFSIVYLLLFKTSFLISKLNLTADLSAEPMEFTMHRSSVYAIAIITSGILILVFSIPSLVNQLYIWYLYVDAKKRYYITDVYDYGRLLVPAAEVIIGLLFLGNQRKIVSFIELRSRQARVQETANDNL